MTKTSVAISKCENYEFSSVYSAVKSAIDHLGGIERFVKPKERILLKPNLLSAKEPERHITTHPEVVRSVLRLIKSAGAIPILGDSPGGAIKGVERVWEKTGMKRLAEEEGIELINFETAGSFEHKIDHPTIDSIHISKAVLNCDGIINLPKLKTHGLMLFTGCIKNFYGIIPGLRKAEYHKLAPFPEEFGHLIGEIYLFIRNKVRLNIVDGITGMEGNGPSSGELRQLNAIIAGTDGLAVDTTITAMLGFKPKKIEPFRYLNKHGAGVDSLDMIEVLGDKNLLKVRKFKFPSNWYINLVPKFLVKLLTKFLWMKPVIIEDKCTICMMCVDSCPVKTITFEKGKKPKVDWPGCISCLCCHELCQYGAIKLESSPLSKLFIRQ